MAAAYAVALAFFSLEIGVFGGILEVHVMIQAIGVDAFPWGAWPRDAAVTRTSKQAGKALRSQGHQYARVM